ncbi:Transcriptional regulator [Hahella chejuensis KCTC 2396]|uniref:Transcriptional regulator n=1 Tax=Hahella chejuensis (strain KCTC 2396) TaxID=349521 RepID=Q2S8T3_HAHCH|nr:LysR family transcriptional regulator [Hahella chejuensis]ABC32941.1 Transcriptional regulator [Hahella chejuensis KCTC 2396]
MDRIDALQVFARVAETGSFTRAADLCELPRSTVSSVVQKLEASLGARLLHRTTRRVSLTHDGAALLERCRHLLTEIEEIESMFREPGARVSGKLKVDVPSRFGSRVIAPALPDFFERYPEIELELGATDRTVDLIQEGVDCVVRVGDPGSASLVARPLGKMELVNCASPAYLARYGAPQTPDDLSEHRAVRFASPNTGRAEPWEYVQDGELHYVEMRSWVTVNNAETYVACALAGMGLLQAPEYDVRHLLQSGDLVEVLPNARAEAMQIYAMYPHRRQLSRRVRVFIDWVGELVKTVCV